MTRTEMTTAHEVLKRLRHRAEVTHNVMIACRTDVEKFKDTQWEDFYRERFNKYFDLWRRACDEVDAVAIQLGEPTI